MQYCISYEFNIDLCKYILLILMGNGQQFDILNCFFKINQSDCSHYIILQRICLLLNLTFFLI